VKREKSRETTCHECKGAEGGVSKRKNGRRTGSFQLGKKKTEQRNRANVTSVPSDILGRMHVRIKKRVSTPIAEVGGEANALAGDASLAIREEIITLSSYA